MRAPQAMPLQHRQARPAAEGSIGSCAASCQVRCQAATRAAERAIHALSGASSRARGITAKANLQHFRLHPVKSALTVVKGCTSLPLLLGPWTGNLAPGRYNKACHEIMTSCRTSQRS